MELTSLREQIDALDAQIAPLLEKRLHICAKLAGEKTRTGAPVRDMQRETLLLSRVKTLGGPLRGKYIRALYVELLRISRAYQAELIADPSMLTEHTAENG